MRCERVRRRPNILPFAKRDKIVGLFARRGAVEYISSIGF
jgi:hypothetical protein